ncbi:MAG TPA: zinc ribbon domain-containing protein [Candidatus Limnocylindrales bacterium]|nr:zinc ribbon domain-containing protein [Candidatus Limnocylindrales bacterium]
MTDPWSEPTRPAAGPRCPWCSAELPGDPATCPSCGAKLREDEAAEIPGVTALDPASTVVGRPAPRSRGLLGWLSGEYESAEAPSERASVVPPSEAVRAEMARLELAALQAEIEAADAQAAAERGQVTGPSEPDAPAA